jgi:hypothetical protein
VWGRLGELGLRRSGVLEYDDGTGWRPVPRADIRGLRGGGEDGIFALKVRGRPDERLRIGVG